jgi:hypothetical protein
MGDGELWKNMKVELRKINKENGEMQLLLEFL